MVRFIQTGIPAAAALVLISAGLSRGCPPPVSPIHDLAATPLAPDAARAELDRRILRTIKDQESKSSKPVVQSQDPGKTKPAPAAPSTPDSAVPTSPAPEWLARLVPDPGSPEQKVFTQRQKTKAQQEQELRKLRAKFFRSTHNTEIRQVGISKLRAYTDPAIFPSLITIFQGEGADTEAALLDHLADLRTDEADASLAWAAVFGKEKPFREAAAIRLAARAKQLGQTSRRVKWVVSLGLRDNSNTSVVAAARLAQGLQLYDAIPMLINAQVTQTAGPSKADDGGDAALAYILVGRQEAFVSGLTPVVGNNAVAFNPQLSVLTEGVVLRVIDAVVITYRVEVNAALIGLSTQGYGQSTAYLGWDQKAWREWFARDFTPYRAKKDAEVASATTVQPTGK
jgi:hypothetical protein